MATATPPKNSDLGVRTASAAVMLAVAGTALWLGGWWWAAFVAAVATGALWEWRGLVCGFVEEPLAHAVWVAAGVLYIGVAAAVLLALRTDQFTIWAVATVVLAVISTDTGAYFTGRTLKGPKIFPAVSPSKTWSGLAGGMAGATVMLFLISQSHVLQRTEAASGDAEFYLHPFLDWKVAPWAGIAVAIVAQTGDFFESWMKRRAGVKDSGRLIPGHGGLFDRVDGLLAVLFVIGVLALAGTVTQS